MVEREGPARSSTENPPADGDERCGIDSVLVVTPRWTRDGGVSTHAIASAAALAGAGVEVTVLCARADRSERDAAVRVIESESLFDEGARANERLGAGAAQTPDIVHCHQFDDPTVLAELRRVAPVVQSVHGYTACTSGVHYFAPGEQCRRAHGAGCWPNLLFRGCAHENNPRRLPGNYRRASRGAQALRDADLAVCYSSAVELHLADNGIERRRIVPLFSTMSPVTGSGHEQRRRVVFAGRVVAPKGLDVLLRAMRAVDGELVVCGSGWRLDEMRDLSARLGIDSRVRFAGWLDAGELAREIGEASVVALPSVWPEPFGLCGIEAFEAGRPVVASLTGGVGDWLSDGVNGLAVPPGDEHALARALAELLDDPARQQRMGAAGRELARSAFSPEAHLRALLPAYRDARAGWAA